MPQLDPRVLGSARLAPLTATPTGRIMVDKGTATNDPDWQQIDLANVISAGGASPAGNDTEIQYNDGGGWGAHSGLTYTVGSLTLTVGGVVAVDTIAEKTATAGVTVDGVLIKAGAVDGRDLSADGAKLDGIAAGAIAATSVTFETLSANGDIGAGADQVPAGTHNHDAAYASIGHTHAGVYQPVGAYITAAGVTYANLNANGNVGAAANKVAAGLHAAQHVSGGADAIKLDDLAAPDDNTDLDATTGRHGLLPKLAGGTTNYLRADGSWSTPPGGSASPGGSDTFVQINDAGALGGDAGFTYDKATDKATLVGALVTDDIEERTPASGVTVDGLLIKDGGIPAGAVTAHVAAIDHDALLNFAAAQHIDWTGDAGASNIHVNNITAVPQSAVTAHVAAIDHDALLNFAANEHIDWTVTGAADVHVDRIAAAAVTQHAASIDHDALLNIATNKHIDWTVTGAADVHVDRIAAGAVTQHVADIESALDTRFGSSLYRQWWAGPYGVDVLDDATVTGDGSTNDATAINAIATAAGAGAVLNFRKPSATYAVEAPLVPLEGQTWQAVGRGWNQVAFKGVHPTEGTLAAIIQPNPLYSSTGKRGIAIRGFRFEGTCTHAIDMRATTTARLERLRPSFAAGCTGDIIHMEYAWGSVLDDIRCYATGGTAALRLGAACHGVSVRTFHTEAETDYGIVMEQAASLEIPTTTVFQNIILQRHAEVALWLKSARCVNVLGLHSELSRVALRLGDEAGGVTNRAASCNILGLFETGIYDETYYTANDTGAIEAYNCVGCKIAGIQTMSVFAASGNPNTLVLLKDAQNLKIEGFSRNNMTLETFTSFIKKHAGAETDCSVWITGSGPYEQVIPDAGGSNLHYIESVTAGVRSLVGWTPETVA